MTSRVCPAVPLLLVTMAHATPAVFTRTAYVEDVVAHQDALWVATRGGVERYDLPGLAYRRVYTTADGLAENAVRALEISDGRVVARTERARCTLVDDRFTCRPAPALAPREPAVARRFAGARVTCERTVAGVLVIGTAGAGLWAGNKKLTPEGQVCSNHVVAMERFLGRLWLGSFDEGLCSFDGSSFTIAALPARMVNDLVATPKFLYVAASEGLWRTADGARFERVEFISERGVNDLAFDGRYVWATTPGALWRIRTQPGLRSRTYWRPGGTRALQAVAVRGGDVWLAAEDRGAMRLRDGRFEIFDRAAGLPTSWALDVAASGHAAFVATLRHGLLRVDASGRASTIQGLPDEWLLFVAAQNDGSLWIGTQNGAAHITPGGTVESVAGLPHPCVHAILPLEDSTWFATEGGLARQPTGPTLASSAP